MTLLRKLAKTALSLFASFLIALSAAPVYAQTLSTGGNYPDGTIDGTVYTGSASGTGTIITLTAAQLQGMQCVIWGTPSAGTGNSMEMFAAVDGATYAGVWSIQVAAAPTPQFAVGVSNSAIFWTPANASTMQLRVTTYGSGTINAYAVTKRAPCANPGTQQVQISPQIGNGETSYFNGSFTTTAQTVGSGYHVLYSYKLSNPNASAVWYQFFNNAAPTVGSTTPTESIEVPATSTVAVTDAIGMQYTTAITVACTTTATGNTAPASGCAATLGYH